MGLIVRVPLILHYPGIYGGDSVARLAHSDRLILGYQLPLPQLLVFLTRAADPDPLWTRLVFALVGALAPVALALCIGPLFGASAAVAAAVLLSVHPLFVYYSLVPYQESLTLALLLAGGTALVRGREGPSALFVGLACLCRYEAWIAGALAVYAHRRRGLVALLLFGWAPLLWLLAWQGLSPAGTYVLDLDPGARRLGRLPYLWAKLREYSGNGIFLLALAGAVAVARARDRRWIWPVAYLAVFLLVITVAGHEFPPGSGRVSERLAHFPAAALCALAGLGLGAMMEIRMARAGQAMLRFAAAAILAAICVSWVHRTDALVAEASRDPSLRLALEVAGAVEARLPPGGHLAVAAPTVSRGAIDDYVRKVEAAGGDATRARELGRALAGDSSDATRIAAHLPRPPSAVVPAGSAEGGAGGTRAADLLAVFDDAPQPTAAARAASPIVRFTAGGRGVTLYHLGDTSDRRPH